jgi:DNA invertase Pin-like site-specific DNA recombinase
MKTKRTAIYARVSTTHQNLDNQLRELRLAAERHGWEVVAEFTDHGISGAKGREARAGFDGLLKAIHRREIDHIAVYSACRVARSLNHMVGFMTEIEAKGVSLYLHTQGLDSSTIMGRAMLGMVSIFAEVERNLLIERIKSGLQRTTKLSGRRPMSPERRAEIENHLRRGNSIRSTSKSLKASPNKVTEIARSLRMGSPGHG